MENLCLVAKLCPTLCNSVDCSPPGSSVHGIFQARILEWLPFPPPGDLPDPGVHISCVSCIGGQILYHWVIWEDSWGELTVCQVPCHGLNVHAPPPPPPPNSYIEARFQKWWCLEMGLWRWLANGISILLRGPRKLPCPFPPRGDTAQKMAVYKPGSMFHRIPDQLPPWPWTSQPAELWKINFCSFSHPVCGITSKQPKQTDILHSILYWSNVLLGLALRELNPIGKTNRNNELLEWRWGKNDLGRLPKGSLR